MNLLLSSQSTSNIIITFIIFIIIIVSIIIIYFIKKRYDSDADLIHSLNQRGLHINEKFMSIRKLPFLDALNQALPVGYVAYPMVSVAQIISERNIRYSTDSIYTKYVDVCIFTKSTLTPVLVIDVYDDSINNDDYIVFQDKIVTAAFDLLKLPTLAIKISDKYDINSLKKQIEFSLKSENFEQVKKERENIQKLS